MLWASHLFQPKGALCPWGYDQPTVGQARNAGGPTPQERSSTSEKQEPMYKHPSFRSPWVNNLRSAPRSVSEGPKWDGASVAHSGHVAVSLHFPPFLSYFLLFTLLPGITSQIKCLLPNVLWSTFGRPKLR